SEGAATWHVTDKIPVRDSRGKIVGTAGMTRVLNRDDPPAGAGFGPVLAHMRDHYRHPVTNRQLASVAKMSLRAFERQFLANFHLTPQKYLRKFRLRLASRALIHTSEPLAEVALNSGFADQSHFTREFRRQFGRTPREYREHYQASPPKRGAAPGPKFAAPAQ
ncbi:MAG TPA: AraC family transcriptional regulator, partial [Verrucomicrobiae bacterium]|nr:AraC family transcriptional regulator [Verrucomicrobiae bacterium]